ncbi:WhiB family redox-sensing transcriptional regulator [Flavimobilis soli]|uniref:Transcriptional regulator WhiB n=2 Tax=Flavimobilis soli TaxID=442709 RepID=A0A2A9EC44_9MICO|nr:WhiB family redox-sensing transcriptional regulator [Flavimobilis soli]
MRLSMLLDTSTQRDTAVVVAPLPHTTTTRLGVPAPATTQDDRAEFDRLMGSMLPCRVEDPELWFAEKTVQVEQAKALCRTCPLVDACLAGAIDRQEPWGVWGGEVFVDGRVVAVKRGRGRPRKVQPSLA